MKKIFEENSEYDDDLMDARKLASEMNYSGMERSARRILIEEQLATAEEVALMTSLDVCSKILEFYEVVACESEDITIVRKEDMDSYFAISKHLKR